MNLLKNKKSIRKHWLIAFIVETTLLALPRAAILMIVAVGLESAIGVLEVILLSSPFILFAWAEYHCAYKKPGTKFLTFIMVLTVFYCTLGISNLAVIFIPLFVWRFITSYNLRKLNKAIQKRERKRPRKTQVQLAAKVGA